jgi:hypothetical protein
LDFRLSTYHPRGEGCAQEGKRNDTRADPLLPEQRRGWRLMIF